MIILFSYFKKKIFTFKFFFFLPGSLQVQGGLISCIGTCAPIGTIISLNGGAITPGFISVGKKKKIDENSWNFFFPPGSPLGQSEVQQESGTYDGIPSGDASNVRVFKKKKNQKKKIFSRQLMD